MLTVYFKKTVANVEPTYRYTRTLVWMHGHPLKNSIINETVSLENGWEPIMVEASGDELNWIGTNISGIPRMNAAAFPIQKWRGAYAEFIFDHLPREN